VGSASGFKGYADRKTNAAGPPKQAGRMHGDAPSPRID
jgi:hypothetical protein